MSTPARSKKTFKNVAQSQTDSVLVAAVAGKIIRVTFLTFINGGTQTDLTFNSKGAGAGTAIWCLSANAANGGAAPGVNDDGYFDTNVGEGLTVTTGAGATTGIGLNYKLVDA